MCDKAVHDSLATLKLLPNWFVRGKLIKTFYYFIQSLKYTLL